MAAALLVSLVVALAVARRGETDQADVAAAARGDQQALGRLYDRYGRLVFSLALRVVGDPGVAEEVTQDVFLQLWRRAGSFDSSRGELLGWLLTFTRNRAIDRLRSRQQRDSEASVPLKDQAPSASPHVHCSLEAAERVGRVLVALPEQQRRVIEMAYYEGFTQTEIATRLSQPLGTVKTWTRSALKTLRETLKP